MNPALKILSGLLTIGLSLGAIVQGGGKPLSPAEIAQATRRAADNARQAAENTKAAADDTDALATIAVNVRSQLDTSERMLATQLRLEASSRRGAARSADVQAGIRAIERIISALERRLVAVTDIAEHTAVQGEASAGAAEVLDRVLRILGAKFDVVVEQSRELNRKARGFSKLRGRP
ncbi:MAG: hypothetical protein QOG54_77 [Actinomycetota bacterium]|nr:hypothetical protein [Actinomycetota bacterium]